MENYFTRLSKVLSAAGVSVEIDTTWQPLGDRRLRRVAKVLSSNPLQQLSLDFTIHAVNIIYRDKNHRFASGIEALIRAITSELEQFITAQRNRVAPQLTL
jgi:hypothetical protein